MEDEGRSLADTPTWAVATVITIIVALGFFFQGSLKRFGKWLDHTKRKSLLAALIKIKQELMLFGLLSLIMGHWIIFVAKICVKSSVLSKRFYPCALKDDNLSVNPIHALTEYPNNSFQAGKIEAGRHDYCPGGLESFASYESLEQLHRFIFVLGITHVSYSFVAIALAMIKIYSWRRWESEAKSLAIQSLEDTPEAVVDGTKMRRLSTFIFHQASHPWSQHTVFVWLLCFSRQFWSSINRADYKALRLCFITTHQLPLLYDFHNYMLRSMEEEFRDIVGISVPLWVYAISCIFLNFHGSNVYFWLSFLPVILVLLMGTKLHHVVVKLAVEIMDSRPMGEHHHFNLRDELFWFGKPNLLLWLIQLISFQNAFEMATFIWSLWEIKGPSCFMDNRTYLVFRLVFGIISQIWCSFVSFPLYVIVTQMGSRFKKSIVSESVRKSLHGWKRRVRARKNTPPSAIPLLETTSLSVTNSEVDGDHQIDGNFPSNSAEEDTLSTHVSSFLNQQASLCISRTDTFEPSMNDDDASQCHSSGRHGYSSSEEEEEEKEEEQQQLTT